jgi:hypothetical protein
VNPFPAIHFDVRGHHYDLYDYLADARVAGMLVLKNGEIAFEDYELGIGPDTHWISFSMAKSITSTLVGAAVSSANVGFSFRLRCAMMLCNRDAKINPLEGC